ncbi:hypothetical protein [Streptomyces sp. H51]|nr:hypothetical protein [Streptomyces sp. H51]
MSRTRSAERDARRPATEISPVQEVPDVWVSDLRRAFLDDMP